VTLQILSANDSPNEIFRLTYIVTDARLMFDQIYEIRFSNKKDANHKGLCAT